MNKRPHEQFITGAWYEEQYATPGSRYWDQQVAPFPEWAKAANRHHARMVCAWLDLEPGRDLVIDLGSGVGHYVAAWQSLGFQTMGIEISASACERARKMNRNVATGSATDLSTLVPQRYENKKWDLCFSADFMEHIASEITPQVVTEMHKVARYSAHYIPLEQGDDPSHIHVQSVSAWLDEFASILGDDYAVLTVPNVVDPSHPLFLTMRNDEEMPWPVAAAMMGGEEASRLSLERQANR